MKPLKKTILITSTLIITPLALLAAYSGSAKEANATSILTTDSHDFGSEVLNPTNLTVSVNKSTKTTLGQSFNFKFSTGGVGSWDTTHNYVLTSDDVEFSAFYEEFSQKTIEEKDEIKAQYEKGEYTTPVFPAYVYSLSGAVDHKDIVIPKLLKRDIYYHLSVTSIASNAISDWNNVDTVDIPNTILSIGSDSFLGIPETVEFNVEFAQNEIPSGWANDWNHGAKVNYKTYTNVKRRYEASFASGAPDVGDKNANFIIGYHPENETKYPLIAEYKVTKNGVLDSTSRYYEFPLTSNATHYDSVGYATTGYQVELNGDILLNEGEEIDFSSLVLHNIFESNSSYTAPDLSKRYAIVPKKGYSHVYGLDEFIDYKFTKLSFFSGYTGIDIDLSIANTEVYKSLKSNYYNTHAEKIKNGDEYLRYRLTSLPLCSFNVVYNDGNQDVSKSVRITTPVPQYVLSTNGTSKLAFLLKDSDISTDKNFKSSNIKSLSFESLYITIDIYGEKGPIAKSNIITRFAAVSIMPYSDSSKTFNINTFLIIFFISYIAVFIGATVGLFFFLSNKFKNDEFRRMKPKSFIKKAAIALVCSAVVVALIVFMILRLTSLNNAIVVYNPIDAYIIVSGVLSVVIIGYFIRYIIVQTKAYKERKRIIKLKINEDQVDDGTN